MTTKRIAINGFGRIGRLFLREALERPELEIAAINDLGDINNLAYLLKHDTTFGPYTKTVSADPTNHILSVDGKNISVLQVKNPVELPWRALNIDIVIESTGLFESFEKSKVHLDAGAKRVVISAPAKDAEGENGRTVLMGVNDDALKTCSLSSNGSCTTNACSPVIQVLSENPGIVKAVLNTVHAYTATQSLVDGPIRGGDDYRRGRAAAQNITPSTTGAAVSVTRVIPDLQDKFDGIALRVPVISGSLADITFVAKRKTSVEEINDILKKAAASERWQGILGVTDEQLVSSDIVGMTYGALVDLNFTKVIDGDLVKILSWYDNEHGYVSMLMRHVEKVAQAL